MIPITVAVTPDGFVLSSLTALLAPITLVAASAVVLTLAVLVVGIVSEGRDSVRRRRIARTVEAGNGRGVLAA
jgi:hypothetical protein